MFWLEILGTFKIGDRASNFEEQNNSLRSQSAYGS
jgi:hypothetical protein